MDINEMNLMQIEERLEALEVEVREMSDVEAVNAATEEKRRLLERKAELVEIEQRKADAEALNEGAAPDKIIVKKEERIMFGIETKEYRDAFMAKLTNRENEEQRSILADNTAYGDGLALPVELDRQIWDQVATAHPIVNDVARLNSGIAIKVTKMTPAAITKKKDSDALAEETFTTAEVTLVGADYNTFIKLSYAEAKMSQGAMEQFLVNDIASVIGEAVAKDIFARIISDATTAQKVTATTDMFADIKGALALAKTAGRPVIYAPAASYYSIVGAINTAGGNPFNIGNVLGCEVKLDNAATKVTIVDPSMFVLNIVQDVMVESQRRADEGKIVIGGYMRAEGCLRKTTAAAYIA